MTSEQRDKASVVILLCLIVALTLMFAAQTYRVRVLEGKLATEATPEPLLELDGGIPR